MTIVFNEVTWYSKILAAVFFFGVYPVLVFNMGFQYASLLNYIDEIGKYSEAIYVQSSPGVLPPSTFE